MGIINAFFLLAIIVIAFNYPGGLIAGAGVVGLFGKIGNGMVKTDTPRIRKFIVCAISLIVMVINALAIMGYLVEKRSYRDWGGTTEISIPATFCLFALATVVFLIGLWWNGKSE